MDKITISVPFVIGQDFVDDVMCSALEGGIGYWACIKEVDKSNMTEPYESLSESISRGAILHLGDVEGDEDDSNWKFGLDEFVKGFTMYIKREGHGLEPYLDDCDIDACHADVIVQLGLFGKVIFG